MQGRLSVKPLNSHRSGFCGPEAYTIGEASLKKKRIQKLLIQNSLETLLSLIRLTVNLHCLFAYTILTK